MNGKEVKGRQIKVDFDVLQAPKKGFKINTEKDGNKFYNKDHIKEINVKRKKKEQDKKKSASLKLNKHLQ